MPKRDLSELSSPLSSVGSPYRDAPTAQDTNVRPAAPRSISLECSGMPSLHTRMAGTAMSSLSMRPQARNAISSPQARSPASSVNLESIQEHGSAGAMSPQLGAMRPGSISDSEPLRRSSILKRGGIGDTSSETLQRLNVSFGPDEVVYPEKVQRQSSRKSSLTRKPSAGRSSEASRTEYLEQYYANMARRANRKEKEQKRVRKAPHTDGARGRIGFSFFFSMCTNVNASLCDQEAVYEDEIVLSPSTGYSGKTEMDVCSRRSDSESP
eukprot:GEMP01026800.1.p1 GENE.GEMP01026800.1~~GEMP01026800.1.p1  ORF type:complete len:268 (+),score=51.35 GEMP01026800.1:302-1105(+)